MILYVNGSPHVAGAQALNNFILASEDPKYRVLGDVPHPENLQASWANKIATAMKATLLNAGGPEKTNDVIAKEVRDWVNNHNHYKDDRFIILEFSNVDLSSTQIINNLHIFFTNQRIPHVFFCLDKEQVTHEPRNHIIPENYIDFLHANGIQEVIFSDDYFGKDGHNLWARRLLQFVVKENLI